MNLESHSNSKLRVSDFFYSMLRNQRLVLAIGIIAAAIGLYLKRDWLITVGVAPVLIGLLPCAAMCALGLCMGGMKKGGANSGPANSTNAHGERPDEDKRA